MSYDRIMGRGEPHPVGADDSFEGFSNGGSFDTDQQQAAPFEAGQTRQLQYSHFDPIREQQDEGPNDRVRRMALFESPLARTPPTTTNVQLGGMFGGDITEDGTPDLSGDSDLLAYSHHSFFGPEDVQPTFTNNGTGNGGGGVNGGDNFAFDNYLDQALPKIGAFEMNYSRGSNLQPSAMHQGIYHQTLQLHQMQHNQQLQHQQQFPMHPSAPQNSTPQNQRQQLHSSSPQYPFPDLPAPHPFPSTTVQQHNFSFVNQQHNYPFATYNTPPLDTPQGAGNGFENSDSRSHLNNDLVAGWQTFEPRRFPANVLTPSPLRPNANVSKRAATAPSALDHGPGAKRAKTTPRAVVQSNRSVTKDDDSDSSGNGDQKPSARNCINKFVKKTARQRMMEERDGASSVPDDESTNAKKVRFRSYQSLNWWERYHELCDYREKHGNCFVPHNWPENMSLAKWVKRQRYQYKLKQEGKHSTLTDPRQHALEQVGFIWDYHKVTWEERLSDLQKFRNRHGHTNVPSTFEENPQLAVWVQCQRRQYKLFKKGDRSYMTEDRIAKLGKIGFVWTPRPFASSATEDEGEKGSADEGSSKK